MKVLLFNQVAAPIAGQRNRYVLDVAQRLEASGDEVALVHGRSPKSQFSGTGYVFDYLGRNAGATPDVLMRLDAILEDFEPDIVQLHQVDNVELHDHLVKRVPTVRFVHNHAFYCSGEGMTLNLPRRICERRHARACLACHLVARCGTRNPIRNWRNYHWVSTALKSLQTLDGIMVASSVIRDNLVRNGIDADRITLLPMYAPEPSVSKRDLVTARRMILHPGGMVKNKGVWLMLDGMKNLPDDVELIFAGGGDQTDRVHAVVRRRGLSERVRIMGDLSAHEWSELFHQSDLVVFPSRWNEPVGLPGILAMAHGKAVAAFDTVGVRGWLEDGVTGRIVKFNDAKAFIATVNDLLAHPRKTAAIGKRGHEVWGKGFRPNAHLADMRKFYTKVIEKRRSA